jgi:intein-encoded DNA endonuclease-like protein
MLNNRRSKPTIFENQVGYVCKREYTEDRGVHYHAMFIYDGQKIQKDSYKAEQIGEYWNNEITKGKGSYHNCNKDKSSYVQNGIGMLDHKDKDKREILDKNVIPYLCKDDNNQSIAPISNSNNKRDREFVRGTIPKSKSNVGRPRSE